MTNDPAQCSCGGEPLSQRVWLNLDQAAEYSTFSRRTLEDYIAAEVLPSSKVGASPSSRAGRRVIKRTDIDAFLEARVTDSNSRRLARRQGQL
jgi:hypothetical protein